MTGAPGVARDALDAAAGADKEATGLVATAADNCEAPNAKAALLADAAASTGGATGVNSSDAADAAEARSESESIFGVISIGSKPRSAAAASAAARAMSRSNHLMLLDTIERSQPFFLYARSTTCESTPAAARATVRIPLDSSQTSSAHVRNDCFPGLPPPIMLRKTRYISLLF